jgi:sortase (surface protein transpeptidase)
VVGGVVGGVVDTALRPGRLTALLSRLVILAVAVAQDAPARLQVPAIGVDAPVQGLLPDLGGALTAPVDPARAGWLASGPAPGDVGPAVVTGHVTYRGPAVFARLAELVPGDEVRVDRGDGVAVRFVVTRVARYPKTAFPTAEVYGPTPDPQLRLITCGGELDPTQHSYADNVVVYAREN